MALKQTPVVKEAQKGRACCQDLLGVAPQGDVRGDHEEVVTSGS